MRAALKQAVEAMLCFSGYTRLNRRRHRRDTIVLAYHNIVPDGAPVRGDTSLHLPQRAFARQLDLLARTHDVIPVTELATPGSQSRPRAIITFDDAYRGAVTAGVAELAKRGLPATIFVAPAFLGGASFWWDALAAGDAGLSSTLRDTVLQELAGKDAGAREWAVANSSAPQRVPAHQEAASEAELAAAIATGVITLGSHTWSHPNLTRLEASELAEELTRPLEWLRARFGATLPVLTYPYGLQSTAVQRAADQAGYQSAFLITGGWLPRTDLQRQRFALPRLNVPAGLSLRGFEMRVSGLRIQ